MIRKKGQTIIGLIFIVLLVGLPAWAVLAAPAVEAGLPSRETPTPAPQPGGDKENNVPVGAWIEAWVMGDAPAGAWSVVQWQNSAGGWEDVAGWQGPLPQNTRWWVAEKDFGSGPFRWVITQGSGGPEAGASRPFHLPDEANQALRVEVIIR